MIKIKLLRKDLAKQRIKRLIDLAIKNYKVDKKFSMNCIRIAYNIKNKFNLDFPSYFKNLYCKNCFNLLIPPNGARIRIKTKKKNLKIITTCLNCNKLIIKEVSKFKK